MRKLLDDGLEGAQSSVLSSHLTYNYIKTMG